MPDTKAVRERAAEIIRERGWWKGWNGPNGQVCIMHAIGIAARFDGQMVREVCLEIYNELGTRNHTRMGLGRWNDAQSSPEPVIAALRGRER